MKTTCLLLGFMYVLLSGCVADPTEQNGVSHLPISEKEAPPPYGWFDWCNRNPDDKAC